MVAVKEFEARGVKAAAFQSDQADASSAPQLIDDTTANNSALDRMHATNYTGVIAIIRAAAPKIRDGGRIINIGSGIASRAGGPGFADYAATKAGIVGYTKGAVPFSRRASPGRRFRCPRKSLHPLSLSSGGHAPRLTPSSSPPTPERCDEDKPSPTQSAWR
ncbi:SDR family NAD(P)-dependent oxidoreductase [Kibdelosporangium philippinense]|uniref:SDR family NAD(P)-dependent oxidoreductase n=1 Tax=Kibdelosporangium philippinense TaxID=211113 RepID=UPI00361C6CD6